MNAWAIFDSANSAHALVITSAVFPIYYLQVTSDDISLGRLDVQNGTLYAFALSFSYLLVACITPLLSGMADYSGRRLSYLKRFTYLGGISCISLFFFTGMGELWFGLIAFILSMVGFAGGLVFYNAFLPLIATPDRFDRLSARGFSFGYFGSVLLLVLNLAMITYPEAFGLNDGLTASRVSFLSVGVWWILLAQIPFKLLPQDKSSKMTRRGFKMGYIKIRRVWKNLSNEQDTKRFLGSFFLYSVGVQTIILLAATFAETIMAFETSELILIILLIQIVAIIGATLFARLSEIWGNKLTLMIQIGIWLCVCLMAYFVDTKTMFYMIAALVGLVLGGIQSLSRSSYAKLIHGNPKEATSYFSFYEVLEKISIVIGTFTFGVTIQITGSMRASALALMLFFIAGMLLISRVKFTPKIKNSESVALAN